MGPPSSMTSPKLVEIPDPKLQEFIFTLRRGVKIHSHPDNPASGEELTSEDCKQSFIRRGTAITAPDKRLALAIAGTRGPGCSDAAARPADARSAHLFVQANAALHPGLPRTRQARMVDPTSQSHREVWRVFSSGAPEDCSEAGPSCSESSVEQSESCSPGIRNTSLALAPGSIGSFSYSAANHAHLVSALRIGPLGCDHGRD